MHGFRIGASGPKWIMDKKSEIWRIEWKVGGWRLGGGRVMMKRWLSSGPYPDFALQIDRRI